MEIRFVDVKGKMVKLACFDGEERKDLWVPRASLNGVSFSDLRGATISDAEINSVESNGYTFDNLMKGVIEKDGDVLVEIDRSNGRKTTRSQSQSNGQRSSSERRQNRQNGDQRRMSGSGYIKINEVEEKTNSFLVKGVHIKGDERNDVNFYISKRMLGDNSLEDKIITSPELAELEKNGSVFTVLSKGVLKDRDGNKVELAMPAQKQRRSRS